MPKTTKSTSEKAPKRTRRSPEVIKKLLIKAAREEFKQSGFFGATTASIAASADVTEAQLFRYFPSKAELFRTAVFEPMNEHFAEFNDRSPYVKDGEGGSWERAHQYISELQEFLDEHSKLLLAVVVAQIFQSGQLKNIDSVESLEDYFKRGADMMSLRVDETAGINPELLVRVSFAALMGCVLFKDWFFPRGMAKESDINEAIINFVADGVKLHRPVSSKETSKSTASSKAPAARNNKKSASARKPKTS